MKFKLDENWPIELQADLRAAGYEAHTVVDEGLAGTVDAVILERARAEDRILWTMDKGIGDVRVYPPALYPGIVLFRPSTSGRGAVLSLVRRHLSELLQAHVSGRLLVVTELTIRVR